MKMSLTSGIKICWSFLVGKMTVSVLEDGRDRRDSVGKRGYSFDFVLQIEKLEIVVRKILYDGGFFQTNL